jgi:GT2 family glycosyltransferase
VGGGLDPAFFMYAEEFDLCQRLGNAGWRVRYLPAAEVVHLGGQSSYRAPSATKSRFIIQGWRSKFRYLRKHHGRAAELTFAAAFVAGGAARALATGVMAGVRRLAGQHEASDGLWARSSLNARLVAMAVRPERRAADRLPTTP